ncbi:MAG: hypothetical protein HC846_08100 [Blastocatellia bacterium]|nr:hypothetical protein [Blastocatellia bacterium]
MGSANPDDYLLRRLTEQLLLENDIDQVSLNLSFSPRGQNDDSQRLLLGIEVS